MAIRTAPDDGYDCNPQKIKWRHLAWSTARRILKRRRQRTCLLMPSIEGSEIRTAIQNGFKIDELVFVDDNPAIAATLTRANPLRKRSYGCGVDVAAERLRDDGLFLDFANIDFCGNMGQFDTIQHIANTGVFDRGCVVGINIMRGRDSEEEQACAAINLARVIRLQEIPFPGAFRPIIAAKRMIGNKAAPLDVARFVGMYAALGGCYTDFDEPECNTSGKRIVHPILWHTYKSTAGTQTMGFGMFWVEDYASGDYTDFATLDAYRVAKAISPFGEDAYFSSNIPVPSREELLKHLHPGWSSSDVANAIALATTHAG